MPTSAFAQDLALEEIVVTAQKREESVQDIPVSVTAITADTIESLGIVTTADVVRVAPSLTVTESNNKTNSNFIIRGIGTNLFGTSAEQAVAMIVDDVAMPQQGQSISNLMDIERIEVLRGPQSTLFGKAASAGAINITTKGPTEEFEGSVELIATDEEMIKTFGSISGPLSDDVGFRLSGYWTDRDGYAENLSPGIVDTNGEESYGLRGKLRWEISETVTAELSAYYSEEESECCARTWHAISPGAAFFGALPQSLFAAGIDISSENSTHRLDTTPNSTTESSGANLRLSFNIGEYELLSISAVDQWEYLNDEDVDFGDLDVLAILTRGALSGGFYSRSVRDMEFLSQEFRLLSPQHDNYDYLIGLYYLDTETDRTFFRNIPIAPSNLATTAGTEYIGVFGQFNWHFTDRTSSSIGLRWFEEEISGSFTNMLPPVPTTVGGSNKDSDVVGKVSLQHDITDDNMIFASYTRGYKGQMYDLQPQFSQNDVDNPVQAEESDAFEIGLKSTLFDRRLQLNVTAFHTNYDNFQVQTIDTSGPVIMFYVKNAGELETQGLEIESIALLSETLTATFNAAFVDSSVNDLVGVPCYTGQTPAQGCVGGGQTVDGGTLPNSPETKYTVMLDYRRPLGSTSIDFFANALYRWQDDVIFNINQQPSLDQESYGIADLRFGISDQNGRYEITAFVNNVFDEFYRGDSLDLSVLFQGTGSALAHLVPRNSQRYYGLRTKLNF